eukprot:jgi/Botrbrau1/18647/Bobra.0367s0083.1
MAKKGSWSVQIKRISVKEWSVLMESPEGLQKWQEKVHGGRPLQITRWGSMHEEKASNGIILRSQTRALIFDCPIDGPKWVQKLAGVETVRLKDEQQRIVEETEDGQVLRVHIKSNISFFPPSSESFETGRVRYQANPIGDNGIQVSAETEAYPSHLPMGWALRGPMVNVIARYEQRSAIGFLEISRRLCRDFVAEQGRRLSIDKEGVRSLRPSRSFGELGRRISSLRSLSSEIRPGPLLRSSSDGFTGQSSPRSEALSEEAPGCRGSLSAGDVHRMAELESHDLRMRDSIPESPGQFPQVIGGSLPPNADDKGYTGTQRPTAQARGGRILVPPLNLAALQYAQYGLGGPQGRAAIATPPGAKRAPRLSRRLFKPDVGEGDIGSQLASSPAAEGTSWAESSSMDGAGDRQEEGLSCPQGSGTSEYSSAEEGVEGGFSSETEQLWKEGGAFLADDQLQAKAATGTSTNPPVAGEPVPLSFSHRSGRSSLRGVSHHSPGSTREQAGHPTPFSEYSPFLSPFSNVGHPSKPAPEHLGKLVDGVAPAGGIGSEAPGGTDQSQDPHGGPTPLESGLQARVPEDSAIHMHGYPQSSQADIPGVLECPVNYEPKNLVAAFEQVAADVYVSASIGTHGGKLAGPFANGPPHVSETVVGVVHVDGGGGRGPQPDHKDVMNDSKLKGSNPASTGRGSVKTRLSAESLGSAVVRPISSEHSERAAAAARVLLRTDAGTASLSEGPPTPADQSDVQTPHLPVPPATPQSSPAREFPPPPVAYPSYPHPLHAYSSLYYPYQPQLPFVPPELQAGLYYPPPYVPRYAQPQQHGSPESMRDGARSIDSRMSYTNLMGTRPLSPETVEDIGPYARGRRTSLDSGVSQDWVRSVVQDAERAAAIAERAAAAANEALERAQQVRNAPPAATGAPQESNAKGPSRWKRMLSWLRRGSKPKEEAETKSPSRKPEHIPQGLPTVVEDVPMCPTCGRPSLDLPRGRASLDAPTQLWANRRMSLNANHPFFSNAS